MKRTTVFLEETLDRELKSLARREARPTAALVREALESYVARKQSHPRPQLAFVAVGRSGRRDTAERHEDLLWRELAPHAGAQGARTARRGRKRAS